MKQVVLIEPDLKNSALIEKVILAKDDQAKVYRFSNVKDFYRILKISMQPELADEKEMEASQKAYPLFDFKKISIFIADIKSSEKIPLALWKKLKSQVIDLSEKAGEPIKPKILFTAHGNSEIPLISFIDPDVLTVIIKPYDQLLLKQYIEMAFVEEEKAINMDHIFTLEKEAQVELVKDIEVERLSELGFSTISSRPIEKGKRARYFGKAFESEQGESLFAYCYACNPHPEHEGKFRCSFSFFGASREIIGAIRKRIVNTPSVEEIPFDPPKVVPKEANVLLLAKTPEVGEQAKSRLQEKFKNFHLTWINKFADLHTIVGALPGDSKEEAISLFPKHDEIHITFKKSLTDIVKIDAILGAETSNVEQVLGVELKDIKKQDDFFSKMLKSQDQKKISNIGLDKQLGAKKTLEFKLHDEQVSYLELIELRSSSTVADSYELVVKELSGVERKKYVSSVIGEIKKYDLILIEDGFCFSDSYGSLQEMLRELTAESAKLILLTDKPVLEYLRMSKVGFFDDALMLPLDLYYFSRKLRMLHPSLQLKVEKDNARQVILLNKPLKTALPATIKSVSEAHLSLVYHRPLTLGDHRKFILWIPGENENPELDALCQFSEKIDMNTYKCDFLFFGVSDQQLKFIRRWIKQTYVQAKAN